MTRSDSIPALLAALAGSLVLASAASGDHHLKEPKVKPEAVKPPQPIHPVTLTLSGDPCDHHVSPPNITLNANYGEAVGWWIRNECHDAEDVLFCVYKDETASALHNHAFKGLQEPHDTWVRDR